MNEKKQKLAQVDELIKCLDIPHEEVIKHWQTASMTNAPANEVFTKTDYPNIKPGMFWYEDDTFSFDRITNKKIKAVVELVENGVIYGDLTASELFDARESSMPWMFVNEYIENYNYPCQKNEKIIWYNMRQLIDIGINYYRVKNAFIKLGKSWWRKSWYWTSTELPGAQAWVAAFPPLVVPIECNKFSYQTVRPVLALTVE